MRRKLELMLVKVLLRRQMHAYVGVVGRHRSPALYARWLKNSR